MFFHTLGPQLHSPLDSQPSNRNNASRLRKNKGHPGACDRFGKANGFWKCFRSSPCQGVEPSRGIRTWHLELHNCAAAVPVPADPPKLGSAPPGTSRLAGPSGKGVSSALRISCLAGVSYPSSRATHTHTHCTSRHHRATPVRPPKVIPLPDRPNHNSPLDNDLSKPCLRRPRACVRDEPVLLSSECLLARHARHSLHDSICNLVQDSPRLAR